MKRITVNLEDKPAEGIETLAERNKRSASAEIAIAVEERISREIGAERKNLKKHLTHAA